MITRARAIEIGIDDAGRRIINYAAYAHGHPYPSDIRTHELISVYLQEKIGGTTEYKMHTWDDGYTTNNYFEWQNSAKEDDLHTTIKSIANNTLSPGSTAYGDHLRYIQWAEAVIG
ncbi:MAG: hypothetical protein ACC707_15095 [Thiohalomonadales bacterium]